MEKLGKNLRATLQRYDVLLDELTNPEIATDMTAQYGITIDRSEHLKALCLLAAGCETVCQVADFVGMSLAASWVFQVDWAKLISSSGSVPVAATILPLHPESFGELEIQRWNDTKGRRTLSFMLSRRIGTCSSYTLALAIALKTADLAEKVFICSYWHPKGGGHMFVRTETPNEVIDLSARSHGHRHAEPDGDVTEVEL